MADPITYAVGRVPKLFEEGCSESVSGDTGGSESWSARASTLLTISTLWPRNEEVRVADGLLLADFEKIYVTVGTQSLCHGRPDLFYRLAGS